MRNLNEIFRKNLTYENVKSQKKMQGFTISSEDPFSEKPQGGQIDLPQPF